MKTKAKSSIPLEETEEKQLIANLVSAQKEKIIIQWMSKVLCQDQHGYLYIKDLFSLFRTTPYPYKDQVKISFFLFTKIVKSVIHEVWQEDTVCIKRLSKGLVIKGVFLNPKADILKENYILKQINEM